MAKNTFRAVGSFEMLKTKINYIFFTFYPHFEPAEPTLTCKKKKITKYFFTKKKKKRFYAHFYIDMVKIQKMFGEMKVKCVHFQCFEPSQSGV